MKMPDLSRCAMALAIALFCGLCGCSPSVETPNSSVFANAMEDYQAGNYDAAIAGFEQVIKSNPKDHLAHFQLAVALQDQKKDYLGALAHYRTYLDLRPADDKTTHAADRIQSCKDKLIEDPSRKGGDASVRKASASGKASSTGADKKLVAENARLKAEAARLQKENSNLRYLLSKMGETGKGRTPSLSAEVKKMLAELRVSETEDQPRKAIIPTDTEILDDDSEDGPTLSSAAVKKQIDEVNREETSGPARPTAIQKPDIPSDDLSGPSQPPPIKRPPLIVDHSSEPDPKPVPGGVQSGGLNGLMGGSKKPSGAARPDTYKVQPKETLSDIAERFYGSRKKWRDIQRAHAATVDFDGHVKAGQIIKLP